MNKEIYIALMVSVLAACGGQENANSNPNSENQDQPTTTRLTAEFVRKPSKCELNVPDPDIRIIAHAADGTVNGIYKPDSNGKLDIATPAGASHISYVFINGSEIRLDTRLGQVSGDLGRIEHLDANLDSMCQCESFRLDPAELAADYPYHDLYLQGRKVATTSAIEQTFCKAAGKGYPLIDLWLKPRINNDQAYGALLDINGTQGTVILNRTLFNQPINLGVQLELISEQADISAYSTFANTAQGRLHYMTDSRFSKFYVFPGLHDENFVHAHRDIYFADNLRYGATRRQRVFEPEEAQNIEVAQNEYALQDAVTELQQGFGGNSAINYDFSHIGKDRAVMMMSVWGNDIYWNVLGPLTGTLPDLQMPADIEAILDSKEVIYLDIGSYGYMMPGGFAAWSKAIAEDSRRNYELRQAYFDNYDAEYLEFRL